MALKGLAVAGGDRWIAAGREDGAVHVWQPAIVARLGIATPMIAARGHTRPVVAVAFSPRPHPTPDGTGGYEWFASGSVDGTIRTWHLANQAANRTFTYHASSVMALAFDPTGARLASGSEDTSITICDPLTDAPALQIPGTHEGTVLAVAWSPAGKLVASGGFDGRVRVWRPDYKRLGARCVADFALAPAGACWGVQFLTDDIVVCAAAQAVYLADLRQNTTTQIWEPSGEDDIHPVLSIGGLALSPDRTHVALALTDAVVTVEIATGEATWRRCHPNAEVTSVAYLASGALASVGTDGRLVISEP